MWLNPQSLVAMFQRFNSTTWWVAYAGQWLILASVVWSVLVPGLWATYRHRPPPTGSMRWRSAGSALQVSSILVALCTLLHFLDVRLLPPDQRGQDHVSGLFGNLGTAVNTILNVPVELHAATTAVTIAVSCGMLALVGWAVAAVTRRPAQQAQIQQYVQVAVRQAVAPLTDRIDALEQRLGDGAGS